MKPSRQWVFGLSFFLLAVGVPRAMGGFAVLDSFDQGEFEIGYGGLTGTTDPIDSTISNTRTVIGSGWDDWSATVIAGTGQLHYMVDFQAEPSGYEGLSLGYDITSGSVSFDRSTAVRLLASEVAGSGALGVKVNGGLFFEPQPLAITESDELIYPFSLIGAPPSFDFESIQNLYIGLIPYSSDFSITLDEIRLVPEPSTAVLLVMGMVGLLGIGRRRE